MNNKKRYSIWCHEVTKELFDSIQEEMNHLDRDETLKYLIGLHDTQT